MIHHESLLAFREYTIPVCPKCGHGPLVFDEDGLDAAEGMTARARCVCGSFPLITEARRIVVVAA